MTEDEARDIVRQVAEQDDDFRAYIAGRRLTTAGYGASTFAFFAGPDHVVRVTDSEHFDCDVINDLYDQNRGANAGWPSIFHVVNVDDNLCVAVVERVKTYSKGMTPDQRFRLSSVVNRVADVFDFGAPEPDGAMWDDQQWEWYAELMQGLTFISDDREDGDHLDATEGNVGLTKSGRAVWIDFGI